jgi:CRP-like cAMP-binding protein
MRYRVSAEELPISFVPAPAKFGKEAIAGLFDQLAPVRHVLPGGVVFLDGERAENIYQVVSGTIRCCTISEDGRRQIFRFVHAGDFLGLADVDTWHYTAEAVDHVIVRSTSRDSLEAAIYEDPDVMRAIREFLLGELATREKQLISMAYVPAAHRLLQFLEDFARHRRSESFIVLPMTRQDIGDHLGLTLETVSRAFSSLRKGGLIEMKGSDRFRIARQDVATAA